MKSVKAIIALTFMTIFMGIVGGAAQAQQVCPKDGEFKNFAQIVAQSEIFNGCDVTTDVKFVQLDSFDSIRSAYSSIYGYDFNGFTLIYVTSLNETANMLVSIPNDKADPLFNLKVGDSLRLRGSIDYRKNNSINSSYGIFRANSFEIVSVKK